MRSYRKFAHVPKKCVLHFQLYDSHLNKSLNPILATPNSRNDILPKINTSGFQCYFSSINTSITPRAKICSPFIKANSPRSKFGHSIQISPFDATKYPQRPVERKKIPLLIKSMKFLVRPKLVVRSFKNHGFIISPRVKAKMMTKAYLQSLYNRIMDGII